MTASEGAAAALGAATKILVVSHKNPDGDAVGSVIGLALGLRSIGKDAVPVLFDGVPRALGWLPGAAEVRTSPPAGFDADCLVLIDCSSITRTGFEAGAFGSPRTLLAVDHHPGEKGLGPADMIDVSAPAAGMLALKLLETLGGVLGPEIATCLFVALHTDTGGFRFANTNAEAFRAAQKLVTAGANPGHVSSMLLERERPEKFRLLALALSTLKLSECGRFADLNVDRAMFAATGTTDEDTDGFVNYPRSINGVEVAMMAKEIGKGLYRVTMRSRGTVDVGRIAAKYGGGGHKNAAGATMTGSAESVRWMIMLDVLACLPPMQMGCAQA